MEAPSPKCWPEPTFVSTRPSGGAETAWSGRPQGVSSSSRGVGRPEVGKTLLHGILLALSTHPVVCCREKFLSGGFHAAFLSDCQFPPSLCTRCAVPHLRSDRRVPGRLVGVWYTPVDVGEDPA